MDQACRLKDANSCAYLGLYYKHEKPVNPKKSNYYYRQACRFGDKSACQELMK
jgi:TPR repeat protein